MQLTPGLTRAARLYEAQVATVFAQRQRTRAEIGALIEAHSPGEDARRCGQDLAAIHQHRRHHGAGEGGHAQL